MCWGEKNCFKHARIKCRNSARTRERLRRHCLIYWSLSWMRMQHLSGALDSSNALRRKKVFVSEVTFLFYLSWRLFFRLDKSRPCVDEFWWRSGGSKSVGKWAFSDYSVLLGGVVLRYGTGNANEDSCRQVGLIAWRSRANDQ
jgi:hypothetical protein